MMGPLEGLVQPGEVRRIEVTGDAILRHLGGEKGTGIGPERR